MSVLPVPIPTCHSCCLAGDLPEWENGLGDVTSSDLRGKCVREGAAWLGVNGLAGADLEQSLASEQQKPPDLSKHTTERRQNRAGVYLCTVV